jgi:hypothetical protein
MKKSFKEWQESETGKQFMKETGDLGRELVAIPVDTAKLLAIPYVWLGVLTLLSFIALIGLTLYSSQP